MKNNTQQFAFDEAIQHLRDGMDVTRELPSGRARTLRIIKAGECDCPFPESGELIVTIWDNKNDQKFGCWCTAQEDVLATNWQLPETE